MPVTEAIIAYIEPGTRNIRVGRYNPYFMPHEVRKHVAARVIKHRVIFCFVPRTVMEKVYTAQTALLKIAVAHPDQVDLASPGNYIALCWEKITGMTTVSRDEYHYLIQKLIDESAVPIDKLDQDMRARSFFAAQSMTSAPPEYVSLGSYIPDPDDLPPFTEITKWTDTHDRKYLSAGEEDNHKRRLAHIFGFPLRSIL